MNLNEIKQAIEEGKTVYCQTETNVVIKQNNGDYLIKCTLNGHCIGLTWADGLTLNANESDFFTKKQNAMKFHHLMVNLQEGIIHTGETNVSNAIVAIYHLSKSVLVIRPEFGQFKTQIEEFIFENQKVKFDEIIFGDGFSIDTWDKEIHESPRPKLIIEVNGGLVSRVISNISAKYVVVDYDNFETDDEHEISLEYAEVIGDVESCYLPNGTDLKIRKQLKSLNFDCLHPYYEPEDPDTISIIWMVDDFEERAVEREYTYAGDNKLSDVPVLYDRTKFREALQAMKSHHDCEIGITWDTIDHNLDEYCKIKSIPNE